MPSEFADKKDGAIPIENQKQECRFADNACTAHLPKRQKIIFKIRITAKRTIGTDTHTYIYLDT